MVLGTYVDGIALVAYGTESQTDFERPVPLQGAGLDLKLAAKFLDPVMRDMDGDGDFDLTLGTDEGITYYENTGTPTAPDFAAEPREYQVVGGLPKVVEYPNHSPELCDWDGDGHIDLIVGGPNGSVFAYMGDKDSCKTLKFGKPVKLVTYSPLLGSASGHYVLANAHDGNYMQSRSASCARVGIVDWDGDGKLDLLLGEKLSVTNPGVTRKVTIKRDGKDVDLELKDKTSCGSVWIYRRK